MNLRTIFLAATMLSGSGAAFAQDAASQPRPDSETVAPKNDTIVVTGIRKSIRDSIATKRQALSLVDVVTAQHVGKFLHNNVAQSLSLLLGAPVVLQFVVGELITHAGGDKALQR